MRDWISEVRAQVSILDVATRYTKLQGRGQSWRGACPIHGGKGANFAVYPQRGTFKCYVCDEFGDSFSLIMKMEGVEFIDAAKRLAEELGVEVPERRRPLAPKELARAALQAEFTANLEGSGWEKLGVLNAAAVVHAGERRDGDKAELVLPLGFRSGTPSSWIRYEVGEGGSWPRPIRMGVLEDVGETRKEIYAPPNVRLAVSENTLLFVDDPAAVLLAMELGYSAVASPVSGSFYDDGGLSVEQVAQIGDWGTRTVAFFLPLGGEKVLEQWRAIHSAEILLLEKGIEPLVVVPTTGAKGGAQSLKCQSSWDWLKSLGSLEQLKDLLLDNSRTVDLFQLRVSLVAERMVEGTLDRREAIKRLAPALNAVSLSGDRVLYHAYTAWAARGLGLRDRSAVVRMIGGSQTSEVF